MRTNIKTERGVAGLTILLSLVTFLFVIGLLVMIFAMMGGELIDATYTSTTATVEGEAVSIAYMTNGTGYSLAGTSRNAGTYTIVALYNNTNVLFPTGNYTYTDGVLKNVTIIATAMADVKVNYTYVYDASNTGTDVMNDTTTGISGVTDWFPIFVVIGAMVVLILLTVIIITAIRGSGLIEGSA